MTQLRIPTGRRSFYRRCLDCMLLAAVAPSWQVNAAAFATATEVQRGDLWWSHVRELAGDQYQGRFTGSPGYLRAAQYVARGFERAGLAPAGVAGFFQPVSLIEQQFAFGECSVSLSTGSTVEPIGLGDDMLLNNRVVQRDVSDAQLVFIGYGLSLPEAGYDDFAHLDLRGKILVYLNGGPSTLSSALKAHGHGATFWQAVKRSGAAGVISIATPRSIDTPWERQRVLATAPGLYSADPALREIPVSLFAASFNPQKAETLFAASGHRFADLISLADAGKPLPRFPMRVGLRSTIKSVRQSVSAPNVVAVYPGSDPKMRNQYVVLTAHLDGHGVGRAINGDSIYNGALDNAAGVASLLEVASELRQNRVRTRRSILFVAVTGEERGRLGSRWFAQHPTRPATQLVANINLDMFLPIVPLNGLVALGADESTLGTIARSVAARRGLQLWPDPQPDRNSFIRSDQYSFITKGIPALFFRFAPSTPSDLATMSTWLATRYHAPSDDIAQPVNKTDAARFNAFIYDLARKIADAAERPTWLETSFFRRFAANPAPRKRHVRNH